MITRIRTDDPRGFNKVQSSMTYQPQHCGNNKKDEDNSLKTLIDKDYQALSQTIDI